MTVDDDMLGAFLDGAFDGDAHARLAERLAREPALAARLARLQALKARIDGDFAAIAPPPLPKALTTMRASPGLWRATMAPVALAAGLGGIALGVFGAGLTAGDRLISHDDDGMEARGVLAAALDRTPSGDVSRPVDILYTVRAADGSACRAFRISTRAVAQEGAACRHDGGWRVLALVSVAPGTPGYRPAAGEEPAPVTAAMDGLEAGPPLSRAEEQRLIDARWRGIAE